MCRTGFTASSIFSSSLECQKLDWIKHKHNCYSRSKMQKSSDEDNVLKLKVPNELGDREKTIERRCATIECKDRLEELPLRHALDSNVEYLVKNCQPTSSQINLDPPERALSRDVQVIGLVENTQTIDQQRQTVDLLNRLEENEDSTGIHIEKRDLSYSNKEENLHLSSASQSDITKVVVKVNYAKEKHKVEIGLPCTGKQALEHFSRVLHVPLEILKLIHKGKLQTELTIMEKLKPNSIFLAFGEMAENEDGLEAEDIELIMKQLSVERNVAIKALRKTKNCLVDAIFEIGNDM